MELVRVVNEGRKVFNSRWEGNNFQIKPGSEVMVPAAAAKRWTGDWTAVDDGKINVRREEYNRLRILYGAYERDEVWDANRPRLAVYTLEGDRLTTVIDDPDGTAIMPQQVDPNTLSLEEQLATMQRQMEAMQRALADQQVAASTGRGPIEGRPSSITEPEPPPSPEPTPAPQPTPPPATPAPTPAPTPTPPPQTVPPAPQQVSEDVPGRVRVGSPAKETPKQ